MRRPTTGLVPALVLLATLAAAPLAAQQSPWLNFADETSTRLVAGPGLGADDPDEKDFGWGDLDQDGDLDVVNVRKGPIYLQNGPRPHVLFMNENGVLTDRTAQYAPQFISLPTEGRVALVAQLRPTAVNPQNLLDVIVVNANHSGQNYQLQYYVNQGFNGQGQWQGLVLDPARLPVYMAPTPRFCGAAAGDVTGDGALDLYFSDYNNDLESRLLINDGTGQFTDQTAARMPVGTQSGFAPECQIVDMNGDGWNDIVETDNAVGVEIYKNSGPPAFNFTIKQTPPVNASYTFTTGDLNADGKRDIYVGQDPQDKVLQNITPLPSGADPNPNPIFSSVAITSPGTTNFAGNPYLVDMDGDADLDLVMADVDADVPGCDRHSVMMRNDTVGVGGAIVLNDLYGNTLPAWLSTYGTHEIMPEDIDGDGVRDLLMGFCTGIRVYRQVPDFRLTVTEPSPQVIQVQVTSGVPNTVLYNFISLAPAVPEGSGPFLGLPVDAFVNWVNLQVPPIVTVTNASGGYLWSVPGIPPGIAVQMRSFQFPNNLSNFQTRTF